MNILSFFKKKPKTHLEKMEVRLAKLKRINAAPSQIKFVEDWIREEEKDNARSSTTTNSD